MEMSRIEPGPPAPFTRIDSREKCAALAARFEGQKVVGLWGTALPRQNVDVLLELERQLRAAGIATLMLVKANAADLVRSMAPELEAVAILDDKKLFAHLPFISLLVTNDYAVEYSRIEGFRGELLLLPHTVFLKP